MVAVSEDVNTTEYIAVVSSFLTLKFQITKYDVYDSIPCLIMVFTNKKFKNKFCFYKDYKFVYLTTVLFSFVSDIKFYVKIQCSFNILICVRPTQLGTFCFYFDKVIRKMAPKKDSCPFNRINWRNTCPK